jgi:hypothetical protein
VKKNLHVSDIKKNMYRKNSHEISKIPKKWMFFLSNAPRFSKEHCFFGRFPGFVPLPFWYEQRVGLDEDEMERWCNDIDKGKPK